MLTIPTLTQLRESILASLATSMDAGIDDESNGALRAFADTQAGKIKQMYLAIAAVQKNIYVDTCDEETLLRVGTVRLGRLPFPADAGNYTITVTGTTGTTIPAQTTWKSDDDSRNPGILYMLDQDYMLTGSSDNILVRCLTLGTAGKLDVGDTLSSTTPLALVNRIATVYAETVQPLDGEDIDDYRDKVLASYRLEAQGGSAADYRIWAADAQGVARVYPYAKSNATSEIDLYVEATEADSTDGKGTPSAQTLLDVEAVVQQNPDTTLDTNERGRRPLGAIVNYLPVTIKEIDITVTGFQDLDSDIEEDLLEAFQDAIAQIRPFLAGTDSVSEKNDILDTNKLIGMIIGARPGSVFTSVSFTVNGVSLSTYTFSNGDIPYLDPNITFN